MTECPALALFRLSMGTRSRRGCYSDDSGPPSPPSPLMAPVKVPLTRGFCFLASSPRFFVLTVTSGIDRGAYCRVIRPALAGVPIPLTPPFAKARSLRLRHQLQRPRAR